MVSQERPKLLLATRNQGKVREYRELLAGVPFQIVTLDDVGIAEDVEEKGATFQENAALKAKRYAAMSGLLTLADDSGLEVDALGGEPGVRSKRYAGPGATDQQLVQFLLKKLEGVPKERRTARFRCVIAIAWPDGTVRLMEGTREGIIDFEPKGSNGFGYDPVFWLPELGRTMAQLSLDEKNRESHRAAAARKAAEFLREVGRS